MLIEWNSHGPTISSISSTKVGVWCGKFLVKNCYSNDYYLVKKWVDPSQ